MQCLTFNPEIGQCNYSNFVNANNQLKFIAWVRWTARWQIFIYFCFAAPLSKVHRLHKKQKITFLLLALRKMFWHNRKWKWFLLGITTVEHYLSFLLYKYGFCWNSWWYSITDSNFTRPFHNLCIKIGPCMLFTKKMSRHLIKFTNNN